MTSKNSADTERGIRRARQILHQLGLPHIADISIEDFAHLRGALVRSIPLTNCEGRLSRLNGRAVISVNSSLHYTPRKRFVVAHELGHLEIHKEHNQAELSLCTEQAISELYDQGAEQEANAFASELLMPADLWRKRCEVAHPSINHISSLATEFHTSLTASAIRFAKLSSERCCTVYSQDGNIKWAAPGPSFGYYIGKDTRLHPATLASDYFRTGSCTEGPEEVDASAWLDSLKVHGQDLWEHSIALSSSRAVISLLWIPEGSDL
ncbi:ImmA/IrrE family metallo-endopeptidase [Myxococcus sp. CA056]|uniref:ImmA/IrrE family metallo-endopeptidase n=1 Tax=Myxococcus sp. CA056 TaxID=2741740 RepID=UPI00157A794B|nr:ImmA/IrrE family metallo-endopeptidase [Myxococcus sp. CA056]NTX09274.1 ImmA/IrrE family metallo-endopeptidase [Myxococcus sp. CA056]